MNILSLHKRLLILQLLVEGNSMRATSRIADVSINTVTKVLVQTGEKCLSYQKQHLTNLPCKRIQVDEIWSFCYAKNRNVPEEHKGELGFGDVWTWVAMCPDTKIIAGWHVGGRAVEDAHIFMRDLYPRLKYKIQMTSDGHHAYKWAVEEAFGLDVDFAQLVKEFSAPWSKEEDYKTVEAMKDIILGTPDPKHISTSIVERQNLTMRTNIKRFTRKTNAHSKKLQNHQYAVALHFMWHNFVRIHSSLRITPAMAAGVTDKMWGLEDIVNLA